MNTDTQLPPHLESIGRQLTAAAHDLRPSRPRRRLMLVTATALAVALVALAIVFGTMATKGGVRTPRQTGVAIARTQPPTQTHPALAPLTHPTAAKVLARAAYVALQSTATTTPNPDQFIYTRTENASGQISQSWLSVDGNRAGLLDQPNRAPITVQGCPGKPVTDECTPQPAFFPDMPTHAAAMQAYLTKIGDTYPVTSTYTASDELNNLSKNVAYMLDSDYLLPAQQAALYQFLAGTPGITLTQNVTDAAGRPGIGVGWSFYGYRTVLIFDPSTYQYLGTSYLGDAKQDQANGDALLQTAIVDSAGQQPAPSQQTQTSDTTSASA